MRGKIDIAEEMHFIQDLTEFDRGGGSLVQTYINLLLCIRRHRLFLNLFTEVKVTIHLQAVEHLFHSRHKLYYVRS